MQDLFHEQDPSFECLNSRAVLRQSHQRLEKSTPRSDYVLLHVAAFHPLQGPNFQGFVVEILRLEHKLFSDTEILI